jgi:hypothetical protein
MNHPPLQEPPLNTRHSPAVTSIDCIAPAPGQRLDAHRAISLRPLVPSRLHITRGRAWVTLGLPHHGAGNVSGDLVLSAGDSLAVPAGAHLVMEPWQPDAAGPVRFDWCAAPQVRQTPSARAMRFGREVVTPARELVAATGFGFLRLLRGLKSVHL